MTKNSNIYCSVYYIIMHIFFRPPQKKMDIFYRLFVFTANTSPSSGTPSHIPIQTKAGGERYSWTNKSDPHPVPIETHALRCTFNSHGVMEGKILELTADHVSTASSLHLIGELYICSWFKRVPNSDLERVNDKIPHFTFCGFWSG